MTDGLRSPCARHPEIETGLSCGKCLTRICFKCQVPSIVGPRCLDCAHVQLLPTFNVTPNYYARALLTGFGVAIVAGSFFWLIVIFVPFLGLLSFIGLGGIGYLVGEAISISTNRKRGKGLQIVAGGETCISYIFINLLGISLFNSLYALLAMGVGVYIAITRLR